MPEGQTAVVPDRLYPLREAAALIPSPRGGTVCTNTLKTWHRRGELACVERKSGRHTYLFVPGHEILRLTTPPEPTTAPTRTPAQRRRDVAEAEESLRRHYATEG